MTPQYKQTSPYLDEDRSGDPKETHKFVSEVAARAAAPDRPIHLADIGCAAGDFLHLVQQQHPDWTFSGFDLREDFIAGARSKLPDVEFGVMDITKSVDPDYRSAFDIVTLIGVHSRFDGPEEWVDTVLSYLKPQGAAIVFGAFNSHGVDLRVRYRPSDEDGEFYSGWNLLSLDTFASYLEARGYAAAIEPFTIGIDVAPTPGAPARSWTFKTADGERQLTNGLQLLQTHYAVTIRRRDA